MGKSREIKGRIKAVRNIQRITRTMQMIATSKFAKAQQAAVASKPYTSGLLDLVGQLSGAGDGVDHPLLAGGSADAGPAQAPEITLVLTSERGLCGPYNGNVIRTALRHLREHAPARAGRVEIVGKKGLAAITYSGIPVARHHTQFGDKPTLSAVESLASSYVDAFTAGEVSAVRVVYMRYISAGRQTPEVLQLLPFSREALGNTPGRADSTGTAGMAGMAERDVSPLYEFLPEPRALLDALLPAAVRGVLFQCFNDAIVSEHVARMVAMKSATDNAKKMGKGLKRQYNRARQAQITTELTEIVSGAAALA